MPRAIWSGLITFGLVSIPVKLYSAVENKSLSFHQIHSTCGTRIREVRFCPECDREVEWSEVAKGYEYSKGEYVIVTPEDLAAVPISSKDSLDIDSFVRLNDVDPVYYEKSYYLEPDKSASKPFALFMRTLRDKEMIAIAKITMRNKERLCCLRPANGNLLLETLYFSDELRVDLQAPEAKVSLSKAELEMAAHLVQLMAADFEPEKFKDNYREALAEIIDAKLQGKEIARPKEKKGEIIDLIEALKASVSRAGGGKKNKTQPTKAPSSTRIKKKAAKTKKRKTA